MFHFRRNLAVALAMATCSFGVLAACGDDDNSADSTDSTTSTAAPGGDSPGESAAGDGTDVCETYADVTIAMNGEPDPSTLVPAIDALDANAPEAIADSLTVMTSAVRTVLDTGDFSALESSEFADAKSTVDSHMFENCEYDAKVEVSGGDYSFDGLPGTIESGRLGMLFTNDGTEPHEIILIRRNDGVTESFEELLQLPEEESMSKSTFVGASFVPVTGGVSLMIAELEPGDYIALCFVPVGSSASGDEMTQGDGAPHFAHGMQQEFTVS